MPIPFISTTSSLVNKHHVLRFDSELPVLDEAHSTNSAFVAPRPINVGENITFYDTLTPLPFSTEPHVLPSTNTSFVIPSIPDLFQTTIDNCWDNFQASLSNIRSNEPWGDTIDVKCDNTVQIFFQNVNSLGLSQNKNKLNTILQSMKTADCDICNFVQTSINWRFIHLHNRLRLALKNVFPINRLNVSHFQADARKLSLETGLVVSLNTSTTLEIWDDGAESS